MSSRFEDPPEPRNGAQNRPIDHRAKAAELRERPGDWAIIRLAGTQGSASTTARLIRIAALTAYAPAGSFDAVSRTVDGEFRVYARYIGQPADTTT